MVMIGEGGMWEGLREDIQSLSMEEDEHTCEAAECFRWVCECVVLVWGRWTTPDN